MSRNPARRSIADKSLTAVVSFCAITLVPIAASAMSLGVGSPRVGPAIGHAVSPQVNSLGGGLNDQVDFYGGRGGSTQPSNLSDCPRRVIGRRPKDPHAVATRRRCGSGDF
ncbi:MAG TPA: hypothetical protein VLX44_13155 [Xanthobacteraceae bacterium]|nr:hypothetical protein [Xanthobacteraceae bacterium]